MTTNAEIRTFRPYLNLWAYHRGFRSAALREIGWVLLGSWILALSAQLRLPLPFSPVPVTGQTFAVMLVAVTLGSYRAGFAVLTYLAQGLMGLPFFAGGAAGSLILIGPTGGYLIGFIFAGFLMGALAEKGWDQKRTSAWAMFLLGEATIYLFGILGLLRFTSFSNALIVGVLPFLPGMIIKIGLATASIPFLWTQMKRRPH